MLTKSAMSFPLRHLSVWIGHISGAPSHSGMRLWYWTLQRQSPHELRLESNPETSMTLVHLTNGLQRTGPDRMSSCVWRSSLCVSLAVTSEVSKYSVTCSSLLWCFQERPEQGASAAVPGLGDSRASRAGEASLRRPGAPLRNECRLWTQPRHGCSMLKPQHCRRLRALCGSPSPPVYLRCRTGGTVLTHL